jgi:hypothetical protein
MIKDAARLHCWKTAGVIIATPRLSDLAKREYDQMNKMANAMILDGLLVLV